jgi:hypothetical protein
MADASHVFFAWVYKQRHCNAESSLELSCLIQGPLQVSCSLTAG